jgi:hypothetical protein
MRRRAPLLAGLALFVAALLARLYRLDAQSFWLDEGSSWELSRLPWGHLLRDLFSPSSAYPLYHLLLKGWMALAGDSEWALRLPSAVAGAAAVAMIYFAAAELERLGRGRLAPPLSRYALAAALLTLAAPYPIWYGQEAKVYALLLLCAALIVWLLCRALRLGTPRAWLLLGAVCAIALFVHRLSALLVVAAGLAAALHWLWAAPRTPRVRALALILPALAGGLLIWMMVEGLGGEAAAGRAEAGAAIPAGVPAALWFTFVRFSLDRWPGDAPWWWLLPFAALLVWGAARAAAELRDPARRPRAATLLALLLAPLALFLGQLLFTRLYEARYLIIIYPAWALLLAFPLIQQEGALWSAPARRTAGSFAGLLAACLGAGGLALFQPTFGIFSGAAVKEQYREAIAELAVRVHPDDAVVIHPGYIAPLYSYYMSRLSADPAPEPITFANFWQGETSYGRREWEIELRASLAGYTRSFLLIAPDHARTVDRPNAAFNDEYGMVGNYWRFSREVSTWPCGIWRYNGAHLLCQEAPEAYGTGAVQAPATPVGAVFGDNLALLGYTLKATTPDGPGVYRAGGNLPISLFWDVGATPAQSLAFFLHLCRDCEQPPLAQSSGPPLEGYLPTDTWLPGKPARDDRAIHLPADLEPGRYTLLLGVFDPNDPTPAGRLPVEGEGSLGAGRLMLGTVEIVAGDAPGAGVARQP